MLNEKKTRLTLNNNTILNTSLKNKFRANIKSYQIKVLNILSVIFFFIFKKDFKRSKELT